MLFFFYIVCNFPAINQYNNNSARTRTWPTLLRLRRRERQRCNRPSTAARKARSGMLGRYSPHPNFTSSCSHSLPTRIQTLRVSSSVSVFSLLLLLLCSFSCDAVTRYATNEPTKQHTHTHTHEYSTPISVSGEARQRERGDTGERRAAAALPTNNNSNYICIELKFKPTTQTHTRAEKSKAKKQTKQAARRRQRRKRRRSRAKPPSPSPSLLLLCCRQANFIFGAHKRRTTTTITTIKTGWHLTRTHTHTHTQAGKPARQAETRARLTGNRAAALPDCCPCVISK